MGAYQDVLGDLHNLFGEAHEVLVRVDEEGRSEIEDVLPGETCERVLEYMNYDRTHLLDSINEQLVRAAAGGMKKAEVQSIYREFESVLPRYTYLER
jgi:arginine decarboxylase